MILVSSLRAEDVEKMGMTPADSLDEAIRKAERLLGGLPPPLVIPDAGYVLPYVAGNTVSPSPGIHSRSP